MQQSSTSAVQSGSEPIHRVPSARGSALSWKLALLIMPLGLAIGYGITRMPTYFTVAAGAAVLLGLLIVRNLQAGLFMFACISAFAFGESPAIQSPNSGYRAGLMPSEMLIGFLAILWIGRMWFTDRVRFGKSDLNLPLGALVLTSLVSLLVNNIQQSSRQLLFHQLPITQFAEVGLLLCSVSAYFLTVGVLKERKWIERLFYPVVAIGAYVAVFLVLGVDPVVYIPWSTLLLAAPISMVCAKLAMGNPGRRQWWVLLPILVLMLTAAFMSRRFISGFVAVAVAVLVVTYFRSRIASLGLVALVLVALFIYPGVYKSMSTESAEGGDFDRFVIWQDAAAMFMSIDPVLGVGPGNYHAYVYYYNTLWFGQRTYTTAHSNYVQTSAEMGLVGIAVLIWVIVAGIRTGIRASRSAPPDLRWLGVAATAVFAAMAVASLFGDYLFPSRGNNGIINFGTTVYTWLIVGAAAAATNLTGQASLRKVE